MTDIEPSAWVKQLFGSSVPGSHLVIICLGSYLLGCISTGYYLVRVRLRQDLRGLGSGSTGAKNVGRVMGKTGYVLTLICDIVKGAFAVWLVQFISGDPRLAALAMLSVVLGHIWPIQLAFHGGKGMATSLGAMLLFDVRLTFLSIGVLLGLLCLLRRTVLSGLIAFTLVPLLAKLVLERETWEVTALSLLAGMVLVAHRKNLIDEIAHLAGRRSVEPDPDESFK
jgi:glycerol-3-phosphate acyltransferase PlsY